MASTPTEIPPWKIELIQRKKRHTSNGNNGINDSHRSITQPESDVNTGKFTIQHSWYNSYFIIKAKK